MRALSVRQPWCELLASGKKRIEYRSWSTLYRGPLAIVASLGVDLEDCMSHRIDPKKAARGVVVACVDLVDVKGHEGAYEWIVRNAVRCEPRPAKGKLSLWHIDDRLVVPISGAALPASSPRKASRELASPRPTSRGWACDQDSAACHGGKR